MSIQVSARSRLEVPSEVEVPTPAIPISEKPRTDELVIALVGPIGSGVSTQAENPRRELLEREYGYTHHYIRVSTLRYGKWELTSGRQFQTPTRRQTLGHLRSRRWEMFYGRGFPTNIWQKSALSGLRSID